MNFLNRQQMNHVDNTLQSPRALSICTGIRGLERGVERVIGPIRTIAYVEIEAFIIENLLAGMETGILDPAPIWANLKTLPWGFFRGKVDLLMGGYPCQPFSNAGLGLGTSDARHLWPYIEGGIYAIRPVCCFFENVAAHLNKGYREVKWSMEKMGYVVKEGIYAAEEIGAPHLRERLFILAVLGNACRPWWWPGNPRGSGCRPDGLFKIGKEGSGGLECTGEELADAKDCIRRLYERSWQSGESQINAIRASQMADGMCQRLERFEEQSTRKEQPTIERGCGPTIWPARPGQPQQAWESPRVISRAAESGMGLSIDGYSFREDLLRALGNSVVEQQAECAFRDLMIKHFI